MDFVFDLDKKIDFGGLPPIDPQPKIKVAVMTQEEYDAIEFYDENTVYIIV